MFFAEIDPPRILRPMVERFLNGFPFFGSWSASVGGVLGDRQNCVNLLNAGESVLVFPEGARGVAKNTSEFYQLKSFSKGFYRVALACEDIEILPIAVVGCEEFYPLTYQFKWLARRLKMPAFPITANLLPLPSPVDIYIGKPITLPKTLFPDSPDSVIDQHVTHIEDTIQAMIDNGLENRRPFWGHQLVSKQ